MKDSSIQPSGRRGSPHARITASKQVSTVTSKRRHDRRSDRLTRRPSSGMIPRGSGDHQASGPPRSMRIGNNPCRYASSKVPGPRSAPIATMSPSAAAASGRSQVDGSGSIGRATSPCRTRPRAVGCCHARDDAVDVLAVDRSATRDRRAGPAAVTTTRAPWARNRSGAPRRHRPQKRPRWPRTMQHASHTRFLAPWAFAPA